MRAPVHGAPSLNSVGYLSGLLLTYALQLTGLLNRNVRLGSMAENHFNSIERILYYTEVPQEAPLLIEGMLSRPSGRVLVDDNVT